MPDSTLTQEIEPPTMTTVARLLHDWNAAGVPYDQQLSFSVAETGAVTVSVTWDRRIPQSGRMDGQLTLEAGESDE